MSRQIRCDGCKHIFEVQGVHTSEDYLKRIVLKHKCADYKSGEVTVVNK